MKTLATTFIFSNTWVALCFATLSLGIAQFYHAINLSWIVIFSFAGTFCSYHLHRMLRLPQLATIQDISPRLTWLHRHKKAMNLAFVLMALLAGISLIQLQISYNGLIVLLAVSMIVMLYALPLPFLRYGLRSIPGTKIIWITLSWTLVSIFPLVNSSMDWSVATIVMVSLSVFAQILPFDIRDSTNDSPKLRTIPQLIGITNTQLLGSILITLVSLIKIEQAGFHYLILLYATSALIGLLLPIKAKNQLILEFLWELPLLLLGISFFIS